MPACRLGGATTLRVCTFAPVLTPRSAGLSTSTFLVFAMVMPRSDASRGLSG
ncbi:MAG: hypothetical protein U0168_06240 [Nannocystaceae bacterium]